MTAYARGEMSGDWGQASCQIRSVNHRYLDVSLRLPEPLKELEMPLRDKAKMLYRGKLDCQLNFFAEGAAAGGFTLNTQLIKELVSKANEICALSGMSADINALELLAWPGALQPVNKDLTKIHHVILDLFEQTIMQLEEARAREGKMLVHFIAERLEKISGIIKQIQERLPEIIDMQRKKLAAKLNTIKTELDEVRLEQEMVLFAQKLDISEELDRLTAHVAEVKHLLAKGGAVGRQLDFLMQEFNREANTLASKSCDTHTIKSAVELKVFIEQMREQVQNIV